MIDPEPSDHPDWLFELKHDGGELVRFWCAVGSCMCFQVHGVTKMAETLVQFQTPVLARDGTAYTSRACGDPMSGGTWQGWIEFVPVSGGEAVRSPRETTQPNRTAAEYWATGLTPVYLEGALQRALDTLRPQ